MKLELQLVLICLLNFKTICFLTLKQCSNSFNSYFDLKVQRTHDGLHVSLHLKNQCVGFIGEATWQIVTNLNTPHPRLASTGENRQWV